jgi:hypothetical protein
VLYGCEQKYNSCHPRVRCSGNLLTNHWP